MLAIFIVCVVLIFAFIVWVTVGLDSTSRTANKKEPKFERFNDVEGLLSAEDETLSTYNIGVLTLGDCIDVCFYNNSNSVLITDILLNGKSTFVFNEASSTYREKAEKSIITLKNCVHSGIIPMDLAGEVERVILEVDDLNAYLEAGKVKILPNDDFAWT